MTLQQNPHYNMKDQIGTMKDMAPGLAAKRIPVLTHIVTNYRFCSSHHSSVRFRQRHNRQSGVVCRCQHLATDPSANLTLVPSNYAHASFQHVSISGIEHIIAEFSILQYEFQ